MRALAKKQRHGQAELTPGTVICQAGKCGSRACSATPVSRAGSEAGTRHSAPTTHLPAGQEMRKADRQSQEPDPQPTVGGPTNLTTTFRKMSSIRTRQLRTREPGQQQ
ncbi:hypothetical protein NDU88_004851 [Pleurodeles waltl]|uniref:Uncharacterized protein n=1 Tax=Pleurodeles waltl TaxID=8319 RepID=A0AAV7TSQ1_PLEWA|nr:hypothetical protein NDU88_004851 [Pleurodeles waltl]